MSENPSPESGPSRIWGLILFVPAGVSLVVASHSVGSRGGLGSAAVLLFFGLSTMLCGVGYFLQKSWARAFITVIALAAILILVVDRFFNLF